MYYILVFRNIIFTGKDNIKYVFIPTNKMYFTKVYFCAYDAYYAAIVEF